MHTKNRIVAAVACLGLLPLIIVIVLVSTSGSTGFLPVSKEAQWNYVSEYAEKLNNRNADIIFYCTSPVGPENLKARRINGFGGNVLDDPAYGSFDYHVLILNDLDNTLMLTDSDYAVIKDLLENKGYRIIYLGTRLYPELRNAGIITSVPPDGTKSYIVFCNSSGTKSGRGGFADDPKLLPGNVEEDLTKNEVIVYTMMMELAQKDMYWS